MANFRTTADYIDSILLLAGETTNGNSAFETRALYYLNQIQHAIIAGGNEFNVEVDEAWPWAREPDPIILEVLPKQNTGTVAINHRSTVGTFSDAPTISLVGYHILVEGTEEVYRISQHTASTTGFRLDGGYSGSAVTAASFEAVLLDYEVVPFFINVDEYNNKLSFTEATAGTELVATLDTNIYFPSTLVAELKTQLDAAGASTYTVAYDSVVRKYTITSDLAGADNIFSILGSTGTESNIYASVLPTIRMGFQDHTGSAAYTSESAAGEIVHLVEPLEVHTGYAETNKIYGLDKLRFTKDYPISTIPEGIPTRFTIIEERADGYMKIRFNKYPKEVTRVEINYTQTPLDLYDTAKSAPLVPRKYGRMLTYGAAAYLLLEKNDNRAQQYFQLAGTLLDAMMKNHRKLAERLGKDYGEVIAREDLLTTRRRKLLYGEPENS